MDYDLLPEVQQFAVIMKMLYEDFCLTKLKSKSMEAELDMVGMER